MYTHIIFDVDGTLIDTEKAVNEAYQSMIFEAHGRYFTHKEMLKGYGVPTRKTLAAYGFTDLDQAVNDYYIRLKKAYAGSNPFDGILETLDALKEKNIILGIVTSRSIDEIKFDACLQRFIHKFDYIVTSSDTVLHKPNPDPLLKAMEIMNASPDNTLYIGDTLFDSQCARSADVKFALAVWGSNNAAAIDADYLLEKPGEVLFL